MNNYQLMRMDPRDALDHTQSPIMLHTKLDAECNQQVTVDGSWLHPPSPSVVNK